MEITIIQNKIYEIKRQKIMLDFDIAEMYEVETRVLNQAVKRNIGRFPKDFMFQLTKKEWESLRSQFVILKTDNTNSSQAMMSSGIKNKKPSSQIVMMKNLPKNRTGSYLPYAFTEHGVTMLAAILKSDKAVAMNIAIVRAFISLRQFAVNYKDLALQIIELKQTVGNHDKQLTQIYEALENLLDDKVDKEINQKMWKNRDRIGFKTSKK